MVFGGFNDFNRRIPADARGYHFGGLADKPSLAARTPLHSRSSDEGRDQLIDFVAKDVAMVPGQPFIERRAGRGGVQRRQIGDDQPRGAVRGYGAAVEAGADDDL